MSVYTHKEYWIALAERAVKTAAQTAVALIGVEQVGILALDWAQIASVVGTAVVLSVLTSIASGQVNGAGPSLVASEQITEHFDPGPGVTVTDGYGDPLEDPLDWDEHMFPEDDDPDGEPVSLPTDEPDDTPSDALPRH